MEKGQKTSHRVEELEEMWGEGRPTRSTHRFTSLVLLFSTPTLSYFRLLQPYKQDLDNSDFLGKRPFGYFGQLWKVW